MTIAKYGNPSPPNISNAISSDASGQFVVPANSPTMPQAAHMEAGSPTSGPNTPPSTAPMHSVGTISPPLNPPPSVMAVSNSFRIIAYHGASPNIPSSISCMLLPL